MRTLYRCPCLFLIIRPCASEIPTWLFVKEPCENFSNKARRSTASQFRRLVYYFFKCSNNMTARTSPNPFRKDSQPTLWPRRMQVERICTEKTIAIRSCGIRRALSSRNPHLRIHLRFPFPRSRLPASGFQLLFYYSIRWIAQVVPFVKNCPEIAVYVSATGKRLKNDESFLLWTIWPCFVKLNFLDSKVVGGLSTVGIWSYDSVTFLTPTRRF